MDLNDKRNISGGLIPPGKDEPFSVQTPVPALAYDLDSLQPTRHVYIAEDEFFVITIADLNNGHTYQFNYRILLPTGRITQGQESINYVGGGNQSQFKFNCASGLLLSCALRGTGSGDEPGICFAQIYLGRGQSLGAIWQLITAGPVGVNYGLGWPDSAPRVPGDSAGEILQTAIGAPAAGADWTFTVPPSGRVILLSARALLTTAVAVGNRSVQLVFDNGTNVDFATTPAPNQAASLAWNYNFASYPYAPVVTGTEVDVFCAPELISDSNFRIRSLTANLQAADQWSNIFLRFRRWSMAG